MEDKDFAEAMRHLVKDNGKDKLLGDKARGIVLDYKGQFDTEATVFLKLLAEDCARIINEADDVLERKRQLVERMARSYAPRPAVWMSNFNIAWRSVNAVKMSKCATALAGAVRPVEKHGISPRYSIPLLDLLGFLLKGDTSKCVEEPADDLYDKGEAAWDLKEFDEAISWYQKAAEKGYVKAQFSLGRCYELGMCIKQDYAKAIEWYRKAAEQNNIEAQYKLGIFYYQGKGVKEDYTKAVEWLRKAAEQGESEAQEMLDALKSEGKI